MMPPHTGQIRHLFGDSLAANESGYAEKITASRLWIPAFGEDDGVRHGAIAIFLRKMLSPW